MKHFKNLFNLLNKLNETYNKAEEGANVPVDSELSATSKNPVQNKKERFYHGTFIDA